MEGRKRVWKEERTVRKPMVYGALRVYWLCAVLWLVVGCALGILSAIALVSPDLLAAQPAFSYGRLVGAHRAVMVHGFLFSGLFGVGYTLLPRFGVGSSGFRWRSEVIAWVGEVIVVAGVIGVLSGKGSGREYSEFPCFVSVLFWVYLTACGIDLGMEAVRRRSITEHPSFGLLLPAVLLPSVIYPFTISQWWGSGLFAAGRIWTAWRAIFILSFLGSAFAVLLAYPREERMTLPRGVYLTAVGLVVLFGPFMGLVHLLDAPLWPALKAWSAFSAVAVGTGLALFVFVVWIPRASEVGEFLQVAGLTGLVLGAVQGFLMVVPPIHTAFHFTMNTSAHAHLMLGAIGLILLGWGIRVVFGGGKRGWGRKGMGEALMLVSGMVGIIIFQEACGVVQAVAFARGLASADWLPFFRFLQVGVIGCGVIALISVLAIFVRLAQAMQGSRVLVPRVVEEGSSEKEGGVG